MSKRCFYCGVEMWPVGSWISIGRPHPASETLEHVIPQKMLAKMHVVGRKVRRANQVRACWTCNNRKGGMPPLRWLVICPHHGVIRLQQLLPQLGFSGVEISRAMAERLKSSPQNNSTLAVET